MIRKKTKNTPFINLSVENCKIEIEGPSFSEDIDNSYKEVIEWLQSEIPNLNCELNCEFYFTVINSITQKNLMQIFFILSNFYKEGKKMQVVWKADINDEDIIELADEISELFQFPMKIIEV